MGLDFKNSIGPRSDLISLHDMVSTAGPTELKLSKLESVLKLHKLFHMLSELLIDEWLPVEVCWVSTAKSLGNVHDRYSVSVHSIVKYFSKCIFPGTVACRRMDGAIDEVGDEFIVFSPAIWLDFMEKAGLAWVPMHGAMLINDIPLSLLVGGPDPIRSATGFPYPTAEITAMEAAAQHFWVNFDHDRPPLQKTVSSFIAERLGLNGPNRTTNTLAAAIRPADAPNER